MIESSKTICAHFMTTQLKCPHCDTEFVLMVQKNKEEDEEYIAQTDDKGSLYCPYCGLNSKGQYAVNPFKGNKGSSDESK